MPGPTVASYRKQIILLLASLLIIAGLGCGVSIPRLGQNDTSPAPNRGCGPLKCATKPNQPTGTLEISSPARFGEVELRHLEIISFLLTSHVTSSLLTSLSLSVWIHISGGISSTVVWRIGNGFIPIRSWKRKWWNT